MIEVGHSRPDVSPEIVGQFSVKVQLASMCPDSADAIARPNRFVASIAKHQRRQRGNSLPPLPLPRLGSNQESSDSESDVLPVTPRGSAPGRQTYERPASGAIPAPHPSIPGPVSPVPLSRSRTASRSAPPPAGSRRSVRSLPRFPGPRQRRPIPPTPISAPADRNWGRRNHHRPDQPIPVRRGVSRELPLAGDRDRAQGNAKRRSAN